MGRIALIGTALAIYLAWGLTSYSTVKHQGLVVTGKAIHDFGGVELGETIKHVFQLANSGTKQLQIESIDSSCACAIIGQKSDLIGRLVAPGEKIELPIVFNPTGFAGRVTGSFLIKAIAQDEPSQHVLLRVTGNLGGDIAVSRTEIDFGNVANDRVVEQVEFRSQHADFAISSVESSADFLEVKLMREDHEVRVYEVTLDATKLVLSQPISERIAFKTNSQTTPMIFLEVSGTFSAGFEIQPKRLFFERDFTAAKTVTIKSSLPTEIVSAVLTFDENPTTSNVDCQKNLLSDLHTIEVNCVNRGDGGITGCLKVVLKNAGRSWDLSVPIYSF